MRPITSAMLDTTSKYTSARSPMRLTSFIAPICAIPTTTEVNTIGTISMRTSSMKPSPRGLICAAWLGAISPKMAPSAMPQRT